MFNTLKAVHNHLMGRRRQIHDHVGKRRQQIHSLVSRLFGRS